MHPAESISLITGPNPSTGKTGPEFHRKEEEETSESFLQVWMEASEKNESQFSVTPVVGEEGMESLYSEDVLPEDILIQMGFPGEERISPEAGGEKDGIKGDTAAIAGQPTAEKTAQMKSSFPSSGAGEIVLPRRVGMASSIGSEEKGRVLAPNLEGSMQWAGSGPPLPVPLGEEPPAAGFSDRLKGPEITSAAPGDTDVPERIAGFSDRLKRPEITPAALGGSDVSELRTVRGTEASTFLESLHPVTGKHREISVGTAPVLELKSEHPGKAGSDQTLSFDLEGEGKGGINTLAPSGSGIADFDGRRGGLLQEKTGGENISDLLDHSPSEKFSAMIQVDSEPRLNRSVQGQVSTAESRFSDSFSSERILIRQIAENLQYARPRDGDVIRFRLEPETLGMLQVDISIHENGIVAKIITEHHFVKLLLEQNQEMLHEALSEKGFRVDHFSVSVGTPDRHGADRQNDRPEVEVPRDFLAQEEGNFPPEEGWIRQSGDYRINLYV